MAPRIGAGPVQLNPEVSGSFPLGDCLHSERHSSSANEFSKDVAEPRRKSPVTLGVKRGS
jgi:hypothetical protein